MTPTTPKERMVLFEKTLTGGNTRRQAEFLHDLARAGESQLFCKLLERGYFSI